MSKILALASAALFGLVAFTAPAALSTDLTGGVANLAPTITSVTLGSSALTPTAGSTTALTVTVVAADANGYNDIASVTVSILKPDGTTVHTSGAASLTSGSGTSATYTRSLNMNYYDPAATLIASGYQVKVVVADAGTPSLTVENIPTLSKFTFAELAALNAPASVSTGSNIQPGASSSVATASIANYGNVRIDMEASGTAPSNPATTPATTIPVSSIAYSLNSDMSSSSTLSGSAATITSFDLAAGSGSARSTYWQMTIPSGSSQYVPAGTYTSVVTITAVVG